MVCFLYQFYRTLSKKWATHEGRQSQEYVIEMATMLARNAIRFTAYETDIFPDINISEVLLRLFQLPFRCVITSQNPDSMPVMRKGAAIGHTIIVLRSPTSYIFPYLFALATFISKYGSRELTFSVVF